MNLKNIKLQRCINKFSEFQKSSNQTTLLYSILLFPAILYKSVELLEIFWNWFTMHGMMSIKFSEESNFKFYPV
jgi:hypothetical protein